MTLRATMDRLCAFGAAVLTRGGVPEETADALARQIVETEAFRQSTHGLVLLEVIYRSLGRGVEPRAEPTVLRAAGATAWLDGSRCIGLLALLRARDRVAALARANGIGYVGVRNTQWIGALGTPLLALARQGLVCQAWAQTSGCKDCAPFGGLDPRFSTNPIAMAFPAEPHPVMADFSTATMSMAAARALMQRGARTPVPRFLDAAGHPSCDPAVLRAGGTLQLLGGDTDGHKGYALTLFNEALTALAGGRANDPDAPAFQSFALMAIDPEALAGAATFAAEMRGFLARVRGARSRTGAPVRLPGERGFAALADSAARGIPLNAEMVERLRRLAADAALDPPV